MRSFITLASLLSVASAHFQLLYPTVRGYDEDILGQFPCGGQNSVSSNRTLWPLSGGSVEVNMEHTITNAQVLLSVGSDPGTHFNIVLHKTTIVQGIGHFCFPDLSVPSGMNISNGTSATIQVVTNNEDGGGLYNCADIIFSDNAPAGQCQNGTGVTSTPYKDQNANANTTVAQAPSAAGRVDVSFLTLLMAGAAAVAVAL